MDIRSDLSYPDNLSREIRADVEPELERQLALAADDETVEVVLVLRQDGEAPHLQSTATALLERVRENGAATPVESTYLARLGILIVRARARVIRRLIVQPEVEMACANHGEHAAALATP